MDLFSCPPQSALPAIPTFSCPTKFGQIQKIAFQRVQTSASFSASSILLAASWTARTAANDDTKIVVSPFLLNVIVPQTEALYEGGNDNTTLNGVRRFRGLGSAAVTAELHGAPSSVFRALSTLTSESAIQPGQTNLWAYFFSGDTNKIIGDANGAGIRIYNFSITDVGSAGFGADNIYNITFDLAPGWSENNTVYTAGFNPLTAL